MRRAAEGLSCAVCAASPVSVSRSGGSSRSKARLGFGQAGAEKSRGGQRGGCTDHSPPESLRVELAVELLPAAADANVEGAIWIAVVWWIAGCGRVVVCGGG